MADNNQRTLCCQHCNQVHTVTTTLQSGNRRVPTTGQTFTRWVRTGRGANIKAKRVQAWSCESCCR